MRAHSPWGNDPYDAVVSLTFIFVPIVAVALFVRMQMCNAAAPFIQDRCIELLHAGTVLHIAVATTLAADWISVLVHADAELWSGETTLLILGLAVVSVALLIVIGDGLRARRVLRVDSSEGSETDSPDWIDDSLTVVRRWGRGARFVEKPVAAIDRYVVCGRYGVRRYPVLWAILVSVAAYGSLAAVQALREGYVPIVLVIVASFGTTGLFAFIMMTGRYIRFVDSPRSGSLVGPLVWGWVAASASVPVVMALRDQITALTNHVVEIDTPDQLIRVPAICAATVGLIAMAIRAKIYG